MNKYNIEGNIIDVVTKSIFPGEVTVVNGKIEKIKKGKSNSGFFICPGFIDAHIHIESSMLTPVEFSRIAVNHGTVAVVSDPHEIANVVGEKGISFMVENAEKVPVKFLFGAPSCVPATPFETSGAVIDKDKIEHMLSSETVGYLAEVMNFPGVIKGSEEIIAKIEVAKKYGKRIDGHAPGLSGNELKKYIEAGISTDHECTAMKEAVEKLKLGMKILIREGSAAKNFDDLYKLIEEYKDDVMLCSDDLHPDDLKKGHINLLIKRGLAKGINLFDLLKAAVVNPVKHYGLNVGLLQEGDPADFIIIDHLDDFNIMGCYIDGVKVSAEGVSNIKSVKTKAINNFCSYKILSADLVVRAENEKITVIEARDGELFTKQLICRAYIKEGLVESDPARDILKITVINRYKKAKPSVGFIRGFGLKKGAIATSVAHDSHNIIAVGIRDEDLAVAINDVMDRKGGMVVYDGKKKDGLTLNIAGIMTDEDGSDVAIKYERLNRKAKELGTAMRTPFMTLSFMALLVIPELKIGDKGLFNVNRFEFTDLFVR